MQFSLTTFPPRRLRVLVLAVLSAALLVAPFSQAQAVPVWQITPVDSTGNVGQHTSIALDTAGFPIIAYHDATNGDLKLMHCNDAICTGNNESIQVVDGGAAAVPIVGTFTSMVLDSSGFPVISYRNSSNNDLKLAHCNDVNCTSKSVQIVDGALGVDVGQYTSLALDASGKPVISYYDVQNTALKLVHCDDANCAPGGDSIQTVDGAGPEDVGRYTSLALDASGRPVISYYDFTNGDLKLAHCDDANCAPGGDSIQVVDSSPGVAKVGEHSSLALDSAGNPVISYRDVTSTNLKLAHCNDANCAGADESLQTVDSTGAVGTYTSLKLASNGNPVISYRDGTMANLDLKLAKCNDANCAGGDESRETVDSTGDVGTYTSLALDAAGLPVISYYEFIDATTGHLKLARQVDGANVAPLANDQSVTTAEDTPLNITLTATDANSDPLTYTVVTGPAHGTLSGANAAKIYTPEANYNGPDSFTFKANDGTADSNVATVQIQVTAVNDAPVANNQSLSTPEDTALNINLTASDVEASPLTFSVVTQPTHGTLSGAGAAQTYTPNANYFGPDSFTFKANDGVADSNVATVNINVTAGASVPPVASDGSATTSEDTAVNITLAATDANGDTLTYSIVTAPAHGTLSGTAPNLTYTPAANYFGPDSFTFKANDGAADSNIATVSIQVDAVNDAPVAQNGSSTTQVDTPVNINLTASDVEGSPLSYSIVTPPANGSLSGTAPALTYTPAANYFGPDSFTFKANDGTADSNVATVTINVTAGASVPPVASDGSATTSEDTAVNITLAATDANGDTLTYSIVTAPAHGTLSGTDAAMTYTPAANYFGPDSFTFKANDGAADSNIATVSIQVDAVNDAPVAASQTVTTTTDQAVNITLSASDVEGSPLTYAVVAAPQHGTLQGTGDTLIYTPNAGFTGNDQLTFQASDGQATSNVATVTIQVSAGPSGAGEKKVYLPLVRP